MPHWNEKPVSNAEILRLYRQGLVLEEIGARVGLHRVTVAIRLRKLGVATFRPAKPRVNQHGYEVIFKPDHPHAHSNGYVLMHRLVMSEKLGRLLEPTETIHHIDGNRLNNDPSNLQLRDGNHGKDGCYECADCGSRNIRPIPLD